jgi:acetylglutamate kinase
VTRLVVKVGGHAFASLDASSPVLRDLAEDVSALRTAGTEVALVHGGGPQIADLLARLGMESQFVDGLRVTSPEAMEVVAMALSLVNLRITAALGHAGLAAVGVAGVDDHLFEAASLGEPWGRAGSTPTVRTRVLDALWAQGLTPVVSSVAPDATGDLLNVNADAAAGALAGAVGADQLVLLSDVDQVRADPEDPASALAHLDGARARAMIASGAIREGMRPKVHAALDALAGGARRVTLANGTRRHALREVLAGALAATEVVAR